MADSHSSGGGILQNHYVRIYLVLLALLAVSIAGPEAGILFVTLVTAFGVAVIKAWLVIKHFMHLTIERVVPKLFLAASVVLMALFWGGVAPDVQLHEGRLWENEAAKAAVARGIPDSEDHADEGDHAAEGVLAAADEHAEADEHGPGAVHGPVGRGSAAYAGLVPASKSTDNALPGGYNFVHLAFWSVVVLVAIGTNAVAVILSIGILLLKWETLSKIPILRRTLGPLVERVGRLPLVGRAWNFLANA